MSRVWALLGALVAVAWGRNHNAVNDRLTMPEQGPFWEGDIRIPDHFKTAYKSSQWPGGHVPYFIDTEGFSVFDLELIRIALRGFDRYTCVKLRKLTEEETKTVGNYIRIKRGSGCWSYMGLQKMGAQTMSLGHGCTNAVGTVQHEMMHCLGFNHEHNRPDRDDYLDISLGNVKKAGVKNFQKMSWAEVDDTLVDTTYDFGSVLHYAPNSFSKDPLRLNTLRPKGRFRRSANLEETMGQRRHMSLKDARDINLLYGCEWKAAKAAPEDKSPEFHGHRVWGCDFSEGFCGMTQVYREDLSFEKTKGDDKDWMLVRGISPSAPISGPGEDDTYDGYYLLLYSGGHSLSGERAKVATPSLRARRSRRLCLQFDFHMQNDRELTMGTQGEAMGSLRVKVLQDSKDDAYKTLWEVSGCRAIGWQTARVPFTLHEDNANKDFRIIFEGKIAKRGNSDMGLTWISIKQGDKHFRECK